MESRSFQVDSKGSMVFDLKSLRLISPVLHMMSGYKVRGQDLVQ